MVTPAPQPTSAQLASDGISSEVGYCAAVAEESLTHDDVLDESELEIAPVFTAEDLDFSDYHWSRGDYRSQRQLDMYEAGHSARDFR